MADPAGSALLFLGVGIYVENAAPCDGTDVIIAVGAQCLPLTTEPATGTIINTNNIPTKALVGSPFTQTGNRFSCDLMDPNNQEFFTSVTTDVELVTEASFFDTALGDIEVEIKLLCD